MQVLISQNAEGGDEQCYLRNLITVHKIMEKEVMNSSMGTGSRGMTIAQ
jgi:hypothetical protein